MKKKIIAIFAVFILSFNIMSSARQEKSEASALLLSYAIFKAGVSFTAFTGFASLMAVNGYHMQLSDLAVSFANKYYDYANGVYIEKGSKINALEKLSLATASFISGNDPISLSELNQIKNDITTEYPIKLDVSQLEIDETFISSGSYSRYPLNYNGDTTMFFNNNNHITLKPEYEGKIIKISSSESYPNHYYYLDLTNYGWVDSGAGVFYPTLRVISAKGKSYLLELTSSLNNFGTMIKDMDNLSVTIYKNTTTNTRTEPIILHTANYVDVDDYDVIDNTYADGTKDFIKAYPNYYPALSGKASTTEELIGLMNTDEYLQREVAKLLENQKVNEENTLQVPEVVDGVITYPTADIPDVSDNSYSPTETWYNDLYGAIVGAPDVILGGITDLWDNTLLPKLTHIGDSVGAIPDLLTTAWDTSIDVPMESINLDNLKLDGITQKFPFSIPFDYINLVQVLNVEPIEPDLSINLDTHYLKINHEIDINPINKYIRFFRWFVLLTFIYGLMMITRKVIKW